jgi:inhibitor of KinA
MTIHKIVPAGDTAIVVEFGDQIDQNTSRLVLALARRLNESRINGVIETVPTLRSLMVHYDPLVISPKLLAAQIATLVQPSPSTKASCRFWCLPACYDVEVAPDLADVAERTGRSISQVVEQHSGITYHVYMLGFLPGQAYMGDVPVGLELARRQTPRTRIPASSLGIANRLTCIFPLETPCGWHLIGRSPVPLWVMEPNPGGLLAPGDQVKFSPVSLREYESLRVRAAEGALTIMPEVATMGSAA